MDIYIYIHPHISTHIHSIFIQIYIYINTRGTAPNVYVHSILIICKHTWHCTHFMCCTTDKEHIFHITYTYITLSASCSVALCSATLRRRFTFLATAMAQQHCMPYSKYVCMYVYMCV